MADDAFEALLKAWGYAYGEAPLVTRSYRRGQDNTIAQFMQFAPGKKDKRLTKDKLKRDGQDRRRIMAIAAGIKGFHIVPTAFVDPVPCKETRSGGGGSHPVSPELQRVEHAAKELLIVNFLRGTCLRARYCVQGDDELRADWVTVQYQQVRRDAETIKIKRFRDEVALGRIWMQGRLGWKLTA